MEKPFSQACENNKKPIFDIIGGYYDHADLVLEIGTGTAQHAVYFAEKLRKLYWQTSDRTENLAGINLRINEYTHYNLGRPLAIDVMQKDWQLESCDGVYSSNTSHIMNWHMVKKMFAGVSSVLLPGKYFCLYGPFTFNGKFTAPSNEAFDKMLQERDHQSGLKNFEDLQRLAESLGLSYFKRYDLPANNNLLVFKRVGDS